MDRRHNWLMFIRLCSIRYGLTEYLRQTFRTFTTKDGLADDDVGAIAGP